MKILCFADLHHEGQDFFKCLSNISDKDYDIAISLGDNSYYDFEKIKKYIKKDLCGVLGNHDSIQTLKESSVLNLHKKVIEIGSIKILGYDGSYKYKNAFFPSHTQEESISDFRVLEKADILISHETLYLYYTEDASHCGFKGITDYIDSNSPRINIHGHHHQNIKTKYKNTTIIGIYGIAILDTETLNVKVLNAR